MAPFWKLAVEVLTLYLSFAFCTGFILDSETVAHFPLANSRIHGFILIFVS